MNFSAPKSMLTNGFMDMSLELTRSPVSGVRGVLGVLWRGLLDWSAGSALCGKRLPVRIVNGAAEKKLLRLPKLPVLWLFVGLSSCSSTTCSMAGCDPPPGKRDRPELRCGAGVGRTCGTELVRFLDALLDDDKEPLALAVLMLDMLAPSDVVT